MKKTFAASICGIAFLGMFVGNNAYSANYGMAGCGLGSMIIRDSNSYEQIFVATTNAFSGSQTSGITSGTSNCRDDARTTANLYFTINKEALKRDIARGNGETIESLSTILACNDTQKLAVNLQKSYKDIFSGNESTFISNVQPALQADPELSCGAI